MKVPTIKKDVQAFTCPQPNCGAHAGHEWYTIYTSPKHLTLGSNAHPSTYLAGGGGVSLADVQKAAEGSEVERMVNDRIATGDIFMNAREKMPFLDTGKLENVKISRCQACDKIAVWVRDRLVYPKTRFQVPPNPDMPEDIQRDFVEAAEIVESSPRGAAALLRLAVQKLCIHLGAEGRTIDDNIADFVSKGLPAPVQQALDTVRVIGNESVHPGVMDMDDDAETAKTLFNIVNSIVTAMITNPNELSKMYGSLPENKLKGIKQRDARKKKSKQ